MHHCLVIVILCRAMHSIMDQVQSMVVTEMQSMVIDDCKILWLQGVVLYFATTAVANNFTAQELIHAIFAL